MRFFILIRILIVLLLRIEFCLSFEKRAFVTVVTIEDDVEPAMAMGSSLRALTRTSDSVHNSEYSIDYICLVIRKEDVSNQDKSADGDKSIGVSILGMKKLGFAGWSTRPVSHSISNINSDSENWEDVDFNLVWLWSLSEYHKVAYIDNDMLIIQDIKELFENDVHFAAAPQILSSHKFDTGLLVIRPDMSTFTDMLSRTVKTGVEPSWDFEDFANDFFSDWYAMSQDHRLLPMYNAPYYWTQNESWVKFRSDIKVIHFSGEEKPWLILRDPNRFQVSKYGAPLIYVWAILLYFIANPLGDGLEDETRYVMNEIFDVTKTSKKVFQYIEKMKRGGTRMRIGIHDNEEL
jgi:hypothetical protein